MHNGNMVGTEQGGRGFWWIQDYWFLCQGEQDRIFLLFLTHAMLVHDNAFLYGTIMYWCFKKNRYAVIQLQGFLKK